MLGLGAPAAVPDYYGNVVVIGGPFFSSAEGTSILPGSAGNYFTAASLVGNPWGLTVDSAISDAQYAQLVQMGRKPLAGGAVAAVPTSTATVVAPINTAAAVATGNWFTDPTQEIIAGIPNFAIAAGAAVLLLLLMKKK